MSVSTFEFEKPITEIEQKITKLRGAEDPQPDQNAQIEILEKRLAEIHREIYGNLPPWQRVQIARQLHF